jgi:hypothetical protein
MHSGLVLAMLIGAVVVPAFGPKGAYALGGFTGLTGALLLAPLLRWLPDRRAVVRSRTRSRAWRSPSPSTETSLFVERGRPT